MVAAENLTGLVLPLRAALAGARQEALEASQRLQVTLDDLKRLAGLDPLEKIRPAHQAEERVLALELDEATRLAQSQRPELKEMALFVDRAPLLTRDGPETRR